MKQLHLPSFEIKSQSLSVYNLIAKCGRAIKLDSDSVDTTMTPNKVTEMIGEDTLAILNIADFHGNEMQRKSFSNELKAAITAAEISIFLNGFETKQGEAYEFLAATPSQKKQGKATFVKKGLRDKLFEKMGLSGELFDNASYIKGEDKILPNMLSGQSEGSIASANLGMKNIFIFADKAEGTFWKHQIHAKSVKNLDVMGNSLGNVHEDDLTNKIGDANGIVIREMLPAYRDAFITVADEIDREAKDAMRWEGPIEAIKVAMKNNTLNAINKRIHKMAKQGKVDLYWVEQSRGKGLKCTFTDAPVIKWSLELGIDSFDGLFGVKTLEELVDENLALLVTTDCLKAKDLWNSPAKWESWIEKGYEKILVCDNGHISCKADESKTRVTTSRQHLCPIVGADKESVENMASYSKEKLADICNNGNKESQMINKLFGDLSNSKLEKMLDTEAIISERNMQEQGKISIPGTWAMVIWDLKPMLAVAAHLDNEEDRAELIAKARTMKGQTAFLSNKANHKVGAMGRYPSLNKNLMLVRLAKDTDLCDNAIVLSWDIAANDVMKADTDGDHLVIYFAESVEEAMDILSYIYTIERN